MNSIAKKMFGPLGFYILALTLGKKLYFIMLLSA